MSCSESSSDSFPSGNWVDLSYDFSSETIYWPTARAFELETVFEGMTEGGYYYTANNFKAAEHGGTHLDAPIHFAGGRHTVDQIPLERLIRPGIVIDVSEKALADRDYQVSNPLPLPSPWTVPSVQFSVLLYSLNNTLR